MTIASSPTLDGLLLQVLATPDGQADPYPLYARMHAEARVEPDRIRSLRRQRLRRVPGRPARPAPRSWRRHRGHVDGRVRRQRGPPWTVLRGRVAQHVAGRPARPHPPPPAGLAIVHREQGRAAPPGRARVGDRPARGPGRQGAGRIHARLRAPPADGGDRRVGGCPRRRPHRAPTVGPSGGAGHRTDAGRRRGRRVDRRHRTPGRLLREVAGGAPPPPHGRPAQCAGPGARATTIGSPTTRSSRRPSCSSPPASRPPPICWATACWPSSAHPDQLADWRAHPGIAAIGGRGAAAIRQSGPVQSAHRPRARRAGGPTARAG